MRDAFDHSAATIDGDECISLPLSLSDRTITRALSRCSSLLSTDIRKIQNKSGEPETVENTRWRIMIRCDTFFPQRKRRSEIQNLCSFFSFIVDSISDARSDHANENERRPRAHTDRVFFLSVRLTFFFSTTTQRWRAVFASHGLAKIESFD